MNKKILLLLIFLTTLTCSAKTEKSIPEQRLEGWAGNPDNPNEKPFDYFYMRSKGRGNEKAFKKKYGALLYKTCIDSATVDPRQVASFIHRPKYKNCKALIRLRQMYNLKLN